MDLLYKKIIIKMFYAICEYIILTYTENATKECLDEAFSEEIDEKTEKESQYKLSVIPIVIFSVAIKKIAQYYSIKYLNKYLTKSSQQILN